MFDLERTMGTRLSERMLGPAGLAYAQALQAGVDPRRPFTREFLPDGRVTITARPRTTKERRTRYERLRRELGSAQPSAATGTEGTPPWTSSGPSRQARYDELVRELGRPMPNRLPAKSGMIYD